jgi:hypothetical protein
MLLILPKPIVPFFFGQNLGANTPRPGNYGNVHTCCERLGAIRDLNTEERRQKLTRYRKKKIKRNFSRKIKVHKISFFF